MEPGYDDCNLECDLDGLSLSSDGGEAATARSKRAFAKYPAKLHAHRVADELAVDNGLVYLAGQPEVNLEDSDMPRPFRQRKYFFYMAGADLADCHVTYDVAADRVVLWVPTVAPRDALYFGSKPSPAQCMALYDVDDVRDAGELPDFVSEWRDANPSVTVYVLHADQTPPRPADGNVSRAAASAVDASRLQPAMDRARVVKTEYEVAMIRRANEVTGAAHRSVAERLLSLRSERDVEAVFQAACTVRGTRDQAYGIIAGAGAHAATLHYADNDGALRSDRDQDRLLLVDAGCEWRGYASDVTRTMPVGGRFSPRAAAVHAIVQRMQDECIARVRPGARYLDLHLRAAAVGLAGLLRLGVLRGDPAAVARAGTVAAFFPHGLGHHVGLEVHDVDGGHSLLRAAAPRRMLGKRAPVTPEDLVAMLDEAERTSGDEAGAGLRANMVVTIEPGIYFSRPYLESVFLCDPKHARFIDRDVLEGYYAIGGVRIEDDILVTADGYENLTTAPKGAELLEIINRGRSGSSS